MPICATRPSWISPPSYSLCSTALLSAFTSCFPSARLISSFPHFNYLHSVLFLLLSPSPPPLPPLLISCVHFHPFAPLSHPSHLHSLSDPQFTCYLSFQSSPPPVPSSSRQSSHSGAFRPTSINERVQFVHMRRKRRRGR